MHLGVGFPFHYHSNIWIGLRAPRATVLMPGSNAHIGMTLDSISISSQPVIAFALIDSPISCVVVKFEICRIFLFHLPRFGFARVKIFDLRQKVTKHRFYEKTHLSTSELPPFNSSDELMAISD